ncbi:glycosyltransferase [Geomesophilobacter sediminis]|uniref:Glycosyltransferase n=1 Tax=Geomesophilobacter sediminis TaxID=2798584 RepID=A0A8J7JC34_9BACT|nr:glycosyltransferase [Geomesophilobacter sediminis]MBJ6724253.1 glycosyltransferase [Geomesophilobacter sediminis]
MKILLIGNDPKEIGGVANYTRPLATTFAELGHRVHYLFSGAIQSKYDWPGRQRLEVRQGPFPFETAEIFNSVCLPFNYGCPEVDVAAPEMERVIAQYLDRVGPDVVHIHSRVGLPFSVNRLAFERGIPVLNTIHVYGYLCQKRVMIDREGGICPGPTDPDRCAACTGALDPALEVRRARTRYYKEALRRNCGGLYDLFKAGKRRAGIGWTPGVSAAQPAPAGLPDPILAQRLGGRLAAGIAALNDHCDLTVCVSNDVKQTLMRFGVREERLVVQHIGSLIAERQKVEERPPHEPLVIGNIGGVNYYKGTHVLLDAVRRVGPGNYLVKIFGRYNENYVAELLKEYPDLPVEFTGSYRPADLPEILRQIDVMVLPSVCNDTAPQTIFESFSGGVPIIASAIGGFPDFVRDGENGYLFRAGDGAELAERIRTVIGDPGLVRTLRRGIRPLKTIGDNARELLDLYRELGGGREGVSAEPRTTGRGPGQRRA